MEEFVENHEEATEYAMHVTDPILREFLLYAIGKVVITLSSPEELEYYMAYLEKGKLDLLLYIKLLNHLLADKEKIKRMLSGDFSNDWLPPELDALVGSRER